MCGNLVVPRWIGKFVIYIERTSNNVNVTTVGGTVQMKLTKSLQQETEEEPEAVDEVATNSKKDSILHVRT